MDSEIRSALEKIIKLDGKLCARGTRLLRAVASEAEDVLALLPAEPAVGAPDVAPDPSRDILLRADPSATVAFYPLPDGKLRLSCGAWEDFQGDAGRRNGGVPLRARAGRGAQGQGIGSRRHSAKSRRSAMPGASGR